MNPHLLLFTVAAVSLGSLLFHMALRLLVGGSWLCFCGSLQLCY